MKCPKCDSMNIYVANTYSAGGQGKTQRCICDDCGATLVVEVVIVEVDPPHGRGARARANQMKKARSHDESGPGDPEAQ